MYVCVSVCLYIYIYFFFLAKTSLLCIKKSFIKHLSHLIKLEKSE